MLKKFGHGGDICSHTVKLDFSVNLNPLGMPDAVKTALTDSVEAFAAYPDPQCRELRSALAHRLNVPDSQVLPGNGAADLIIRLCLAVHPKDVMVCAPTFSEYEKGAIIAVAQVHKYPLTYENSFALIQDFIAALNKLRPDMEQFPNEPSLEALCLLLLQRVQQKAQRART